MPIAYCRFFMIDLSNHILEITIHPRGAELQKLYHKQNRLNYLWSGDPAYWGKFSPVLFPVVGTLKENLYHYQGRTYHLPRHGFARDKVFTVEYISDGEAEFRLNEDADTTAVYPFPFNLNMLYKLDENRLTVTYTVENPGPSDMYFSIGAHPAFAVPLVQHTAYEDYRLEFSEKETAGRYGLQEGLLKPETKPFLNNDNNIPLTNELFAHDAIVLKNLKSETIQLRSDRTPHGFTFSIKDWPDLGIWAAPNAPFVCIEPWQGHADFTDHDQHLVHKSGMIILQPGKKWKRSWWVEVF